MESQPSSIPLGNVTALQHELISSWVAEPDTRGTAGLIYSCIFTIYICVWSALHPNINNTRNEIHTYTGRKGMALFEAMFAPELMLSNAFRQWMAARELRRALNESAKLHGREINLSMRYAFYVVMGGFFVVCDSGGDNVEIPNPWKITPEGATHFAKRGIFLEISEADIKDKSKADSVTKCFACIQIAWVLSNIIARAVVGYPVTLLEIHTSAQVVCALVSYFFWFHKPAGIRGPVYVTDRALQQEIQRQRHLARHLKDPMGGLFDFLEPMWEEYETILYSSAGRMASPKSARQGVVSNLVMCVCFTGIHLSAWNFIFPTQIEKTLWRVSCFVIMGFPGVVAICLFLFLCQVEPLQRALETIRRQDQLLSAWRFMFPNRLQRTVWLVRFYVSKKVSSIFGLGLLLLERHGTYSDRDFLGKSTGMFGGRYGLTEMIGLVQYTAFVTTSWFRIYLAVESFISLRKTPVGVYANVQWSDYFPHL